MYLNCDPTSLKSQPKSINIPFINMVACTHEFSFLKDFSNFLSIFPQLGTDAFLSFYFLKWNN